MMLKIRHLLCAALLAVWFPLSLFSEQRKINYVPSRSGFVSFNGTNRYTRALYGSNNSEWRLETSDMPVFATYKKNACMNIRFRITTKKGIVDLDTVKCQSVYSGGMRQYGFHLCRGTVNISVLACPDREGAIWMFYGANLGEDVKVEGIVSNVKGARFHRYGDIGTKDNPGENFGPRPGEAPLQVVEGKLEDASYDILMQEHFELKPLYFFLDSLTLKAGNGDSLKSVYLAADKYYRDLSGTVSFFAPGYPSIIQPLGSALVIAADGAWGGQVWMHGAVGWRMPLPGWRGAYAGDFLGMPDRQRSHFDAYAKSMVTGVPVTKPHLMDSANNLARGAYVWGTPMYSNGYICRTPGNNHQFHHYDMNLNYIDELLWHFQFDADTAYMRKMWPVLKSHLAWEKNAWDPDGDHLYDAYCCIWASDALEYNSGAVTHSSAYNYRGNLLAARIAEIIGEDPTPYRTEAGEILKAMNSRLWLKDEGHWAEYQDFMGLRRQHHDAALWSVYTPIDCGACTPRQAYEATRYVDSHIPHINFTIGDKNTIVRDTFTTISTSDWSPYEWSINNVAMAEVLHTALAYWEAGRPNAAYRLLKGTVVDFMYCGSSPGNFGQISHFDANIGEEYRDFADVTGIASRALIQGLYGITPEALYGRCVIRPGFPSSWDTAAVHTPYLDYSFQRKGGKETYTIRQHFKRPLRIVIRQNLANGEYRDTALTDDSVQTVTLASTGFVEEPEAKPVPLRPAEGTALDSIDSRRCRTVDIDRYFNSNVTDIFKNKYLSPRSPYTTLAIPTQGIGDWCSTKKTVDIDDSGLRSMVRKGKIEVAGIPFRTSGKGRNIVFTSLWDNYPDSVTVPLKGKGSYVYLLMAGSTNFMQSHFENGVVRVFYEDGTSEMLSLENPSNWCPIEQDYDDGTPAFNQPKPRPYRVSLKTGLASRTLSKDMGIARNKGLSDDPRSKVAALAIDGGAAEILEIKVNPGKKLRSLTLSTTANDVVIGLMGVTVQR